MKRLSLQADDIAMLTLSNNKEIDMLLEAFGTQSTQTFIEHSDGRLLPHNNYESDVLDHDDSSDTTIKDPAKKKDKKEKEKKLTIEVFGTDLTQEARDGRLDLVIGRHQEIEQMTYTLLRKTKSNPILIGEA